MSTLAERRRRHPLGLPPGYVRSLLALMIVGLSCGLIALSTVDKPKAFPLFLLFLLLLIYPNFVETVIHHRSHQGDESWFAWLLRMIAGVAILVAPVLTVTWKLNHDPAALTAQVDATLNSIKDLVETNPQPLILAGAAVWGGYVLGVMARHIGRRTRSMFYQEGEQAVLLPDIIAWVSLLAMVGILILLMIILVINPSLQEHPPIELSGIGDVLAGIAAFYFGVRSGS